MRIFVRSLAMVFSLSIATFEAKEHPAATTGAAGRKRAPAVAINAIAAALPTTPPTARAHCLVALASANTFAIPLVELNKNLLFSSALVYNFCLISCIFSSSVRLGFSVGCGIESKTLFTKAMASWFFRRMCWFSVVVC